MNQSTLRPNILKYGLTGGLIMSLIYLIGTITGWSGVGSTTYSILSGLISLIILVTLVFLGIKSQRDDQQGGFISLGQCVLLGIGILIITGMISFIVSMVYTKIIDPEYMDKFLAGMEEQWEAQGLNEDQIEQAKKWTNIMKSPFLSLAAVLGCYGVGGAVLALIIGLIMRKDEPEFS